MNNQKPLAVSPMMLISRSVRLALKEIWWVLILILVVIAGAMFLSFLPPLLLRQIVDQFIVTGEQEGLWRIALIYLAAYFASTVLDALQTFMSSFVGQKVLLKLRMIVIGHLQKLPMSFFNTSSVGDLMSRVTSDVDTVTNLFTAGILTSIIELFRIFGVLIGMYYISPPLSLIGIATIPLVFVLTNYFRSNMLKAERLVRDSVGQLNSFIQEIFNGLLVVKSYGRERVFEEKFQEPLQNNVTVSNRSAIYVSAWPCVMQTIRSLGIVSLIWFGSRTSGTDNLFITIGGLAAMVDLLGRLLDPVEAITNEIQVLQQALAGLMRLSALASISPEPRAATMTLADVPNWKASPTALELTDVSFGYSLDLPVLTKISLSVPKGKRVALVGRTGAGKSTTLNLMAGLYVPWQGEVRICGLDPHALPAHERKFLFGIVPQTVTIVEGTIRDNITLRDDSISQEEVEIAARQVGLHDFVDSQKQGYDTVLGTGGMKLSFGQSQLLSIARAIVCDPPVLLLDEPTSGMDTITEEKVFAALRSASKDRTIFTISHRLSGILDADLVAIMSNGKIVQVGSPEELAGEKGWYAVFKQLEDLGWQTA